MSETPDKQSDSNDDLGQETRNERGILGKPNHREMLIQSVRTAQSGNEIYFANLFLKDIAENPPSDDLLKMYANILMGGGEEEWEYFMNKCKSEGSEATLVDIWLRYRNEKTDLSDTCRLMMQRVMECRTAFDIELGIEETKKRLGLDKDIDETECIQAKDSWVDSCTNDEGNELLVNNLTPVRMIDFNAIGEEGAKKQTKLTAYAYHNRIKDLVLTDTEPFYPLKSVDIDSMKADVGCPIKLGNETVIPVCIKGYGEKTHLVFAYFSESHASWRRFAGLSRGCYYKGKNEHFQDLDWRIQKAIDETVNEYELMELEEDSGISELADLAPSEQDGKASILLTVVQEDQTQEVMDFEKHTINCKRGGNQPNELISFWESGGENSIYGQCFTAVVQSKNQQYEYVVSITKGGIFLKHIQDNDSPGVNAGASPVVGVTPVEKQKWIMTPIVEYFEQIRMPEDELSQIGVNRTFIGNRGDRGGVKGMHSSSGSPFFQLSNGLAEVCHMLEKDDISEAKRILDDILADERSTTSKRKFKEPILTEKLIGSYEEDDDELFGDMDTDLVDEDIEDILKNAESEAPKEPIVQTDEKPKPIQQPTFTSRTRRGKRRKPKQKEIFTSEVPAIFEDITVKTGEILRIGILTSNHKVTIEDGGRVVIDTIFAGSTIEKLGTNASYKIGNTMGDCEKDPINIVDNF